ncbi:MAG: ribosome-associated translation inhibitor RaiA, partial [Lachnospiraceae bacterium]|nr:ribosome-associated translation inhibitor RaiA [Lachnospiraceae bacterium]
MNYIISGKNIDVTEGLRDAVYDKLGRLEKYFNEDTKVQVTFSVEKDRQKIEVTIPMKGHIIRAEQVSDDMYVSIDMVVEIIERQVTRYKKKLVDQKQDVQYFKSDFLEEEDAADDEVKIY